MTIRAKILAGFISIFIVGMMLASLGLVSTYILTSKASEQYTLEKASSGVSSVLNAHYSWRQQLTQAVLLNEEFGGSLNPDTCALGKWRNGEEAKGITDEEFLSLLNQLDAPHKHIHTEAQLVVNMLKSGNTDGAKAELKNNILPKTEEAIDLLTKMEERFKLLVENASVELISLSKLFSTITMILMIVALAISVLLAWLITSSIMKPLREITKAAQDISKGDLDIKIEYKVSDEIGKLAGAFHEMVSSTKEQMEVTKAMADGDLRVDINPRSEKDTMNKSLKHMINSLNAMFNSIQTSTAQVSSGASQIADGAQMLAQGSTEQAANIQELSRSLINVSEMTDGNANKAERAASMADKIKSKAEIGSAQMDKMIGAVDDINSSSKSISKVIKVIDDIAFQTNILALNAAVEAARAGQHGKGFAVVADEVRNLAAKSAAAAKDTGVLIADSMEKAKQGVEIAKETSKSLTEIVESIDESNTIIGEIALASKEQSSQISDINMEIDQVDRVIQQNSATAEESAAASEEMSSQAHILQELVAQFKLKM